MQTIATRKNQEEEWPSPETCRGEESHDCEGAPQQLRESKAGDLESEASLAFDAKL